MKHLSRAAAFLAVPLDFFRNHSVH